MHKLVLLVVMALVGCRTAPRAEQWNGSLPPELDRVLRDYERAWIAHDADGLAALFTADGYVLSDRRPPVHGREAIRAAYAKGGGPLWLRALSAAADGDVGYVVGVYGHDPREPETGKFVLALRREDGAWRIAADIDNSIERRERN